MIPALRWIADITSLELSSLIRERAVVNAKDREILLECVKDHLRVYPEIWQLLVDCKEKKEKAKTKKEMFLANLTDRLREEFIIVSLYNDDRTKLPEDEWITSTYDQKIKKTLGKKSLDFQITRYNSNSIPLYAIIDTAGENLVKPRGYNLDIKAYIKFLDEGIANFK